MYPPDKLYQIVLSTMRKTPYSDNEQYYYIKFGFSFDSDGYNVPVTKMLSHEEIFKMIRYFSVVRRIGQNETVSSNGCILKYGNGEQLEAIVYDDWLDQDDIRETF